MVWVVRGCCEYSANPFCFDCINLPFRDLEPGTQSFSMDWLKSPAYFADDLGLSGMNSSSEWIDTNEYLPVYQKAPLDFSNINFDSDIQDKYGWTQSPQALVGNSASSSQDVRSSLSCSASYTPHAYHGIQDNHGNTPLHLAVCSDLHDNITIERLVRSGADVNMQNNQGITPFQLLVRNPLGPLHPLAWIALILTFLRSGASVLQPSNSGISIFHEFLNPASIKHEYVVEQSLFHTAVRTFLEKGADPETKIGDEHLLHHVLRTGVFPNNDEAFELVIFLCEKSNVATLSSSGDTVLHILIQRVAEKKLLEKHNALYEKLLNTVLERKIRCPNEPDSEGKSPLALLLCSCPYRSQVLSITDSLLLHGANPFTATREEDLPIYLTVRNIEDEIKVKVLKRLLKSWTSGKSDWVEWLEWDAAWNAGSDWFKARLHAARQAKVLPVDVKDVVSGAVMDILAERSLHANETLLEDLQAEFDKERDYSSSKYAASKKTKAACQHILKILQDFKALQLLSAETREEFFWTVHHTQARCNAFQRRYKQALQIQKHEM